MTVDNYRRHHRHRRHHHHHHNHSHVFKKTGDKKGVAEDSMVSCLIFSFSLDITTVVSGQTIKLHVFKHVQTYSSGTLRHLESGLNSLRLLFFFSVPMCNDMTPIEQVKD